MARTDNLTNFLTDVATAIKTKKGDETPIQASNFDTEIANLPTGGKFAPARILFSNYTGSSEEALDLKNLDTSKLTSMDSMFYACNKLTSLDLSNFDTSKVIDMDNMLRTCTGLTTLNLSNFDTSNVTTMQSMFDDCARLTSIDISNFNTSNVKNMASMFSSCINLTRLDLSNFDTSNVVTMQGMFYNCTKLENLKIKIMGCYCDLHYCPLTPESVSYILQNLGTVTASRTLTLGATNLAKATQADLDSATGKGWTIN